MVINDYEGNEEGSQEVSLDVALAPHPSPTFNPIAFFKVEIRNTLWQVFEVPLGGQKCV